MKHLLRECIVSAWDKLDQRVADTAVKQWQTSRLQKAGTLNTASPNYGRPAIFPLWFLSFFYLFSSPNLSGR